MWPKRNIKNRRLEREEVLDVKLRSGLVRAHRVRLVALTLGVSCVTLLALFILWRTGKTLQPARNLDPSLFTPIDTRKVTEIPLPSAKAQYRVVSLQDLSYVAEQRDHNKYSGVANLTITSPVDFWRNSKFLAIVLEGSSNVAVNGEAQVSSESKAVSR